MLPEGVTRYEQPILLEIRKHTVGPVQHPGFEECDCLLSQGNLLSRFDNLARPLWGMVVFQKSLLTHRRTDNLLGPHDGQNIGETARVIRFNVVDNDVVDLCRINNLTNRLHVIDHKWFLHRIQEGNLFIDDQEGVVCRALIGRVPMEVSDIPVYRANPIDALHDFNRFHFTLLVPPHSGVV